MPGISGLKLGKMDYLIWKNLSHILAGGNMDASAAKGRDDLINPLNRESRFN